VRNDAESHEATAAHAAPTPTDGAAVAREAAARHQAQSIRAARRVDKLAQLDDLATREVKALAGVYDVVVIDPPWPMEKIERDTRPNQVALDYPTMNDEQIASAVETAAPFAADCHVWLWTTQRFLPMALRLLDRWRLAYICMFVWRKPGGFQPVGLPQYNAEFALYARKGSPVFVETTALPVCFAAPRGAHSEKPEAFYAMVRRVTGGRRLDMFNRRPIAGFEGWGHEADARV
jgi:N6-adenosine-specific RNA methylase IME4